MACLSRADAPKSAMRDRRLAARGTSRGQLDADQGCEDFEMLDPHSATGVFEARDSQREPEEAGRGRSHGLLEPIGGWWVSVALFLLSACLGRQVPDEGFRYPIETPRYATGAGPRVAIDAAHGNFHTADGRFGPFARLLRDDGYRVDSFDAELSAESLAEVDVLVIANPLARENRRRWRLPAYDAYKDAEISALRTWLESGGALLLIADHMPFPGAAESLAADLGIFFANGYAQDASGQGHIVFSRDDGSLQGHPITDGTTPNERIESVKVFTGQAFRTAADSGAEPLMVLPAGARVLLPTKPRDFSERTPYILAEELLQGATLSLGEGRVAVFGEAAMFTAQLAITRKDRKQFGMSAPGAEQNARFALNVLRWLSRS